MLWKSRVHSRLRRAFVYLIEDVSMIRYLMGFVAITIMFGIAYAYLTPIGHGIGQNLEPVSDASFLIGVYFSIVTITSLGYGNMHPMGVSMALTSVEVLIGLGMIGIMIAKISSQRLSHHVSRLFASDTQKRLEGIADKFEGLLRDLRDILPIPDVPSQTPTTDDLKSEFSPGFNLDSSKIRLPTAGTR